MVAKDCKAHFKSVAVMQYLLDEIKQDCMSEGWCKGYKGGNGKQPVLDRLMEIRRIALAMSKKIKDER